MRVALYAECPDSQSKKIWSLLSIQLWKMGNDFIRVIVH